MVVHLEYIKGDKMKKLLFMFLISGVLFGMPKNNFSISMPDTNRIRISAQDSVAVYDSTLIFVVQRKLLGLYRAKKMYFYQLKNVLNNVLSLSNLQIPRLDGTSTTRINLKLFAKDTLYKADFNYNFRKIDSLTTFFSTTDFRISGDTIYNKNLSNTNIWTNSNVFNNYLSFGSTGRLSLPLYVKGANGNIGYDYVANRIKYFNGTDTSYIPGTSANNSWLGTNTFSNLIPTSFGYGIQIGIQADASKGFVELLNGDLLNPYSGKITTTALTGNRIYTLPNASGTVTLAEAPQVWTGTNEFQSTLKFTNDFINPSQTVTISSYTINAAGKTSIEVGGYFTVTTISGFTDGKEVTILVTGGLITFNETGNLVNIPADSIALTGTQIIKFKYFISMNKWVCTGVANY